MMKKAVPVFFFFLPLFACSQSHNGISYQEGLDACQRITEDHQRKSPDQFIYTGPDCMIGAKVPAFSAMTFEGEEVTPEYFQGKITVLNLWSISCPPCIAEIPGFNQVVEKFGHDKVNYLAIGPDDEKDIRDFLIKHPWKFTQLSSGMELTLDVFKNRWGWPTTFVINQDAIIVAAFSGGKADESAVKTIEDKLSGILTSELR